MHEFVSGIKKNLAGGEHVWHGFAAEVGRMDDVLLPGRVACSHSLGSCHGDAFSHANELLGCGRLVGSVLGLEQLWERRWWVSFQTEGQRSDWATNKRPDECSLCRPLHALIHFKIMKNMLVLTAISCLMHSIVASRALVPRVASSSTALTVFSRDVTLVTITCRNMSKKRMKSLFIYTWPLRKGLWMSWKPNSNRRSSLWQEFKSGKGLLRLSPVSMVFNCVIYHHVNHLCDIYSYYHSSINIYATVSESNLRIAYWTFF